MGISTHTGVRMFTSEERERLRIELIAAARRDARIIAAATTGSAATEQLDRWSDIDLAFRITGAADMGQVIADWTYQMYRERGAVHHLDVARDGILFRVFLLASTLQVDLAFWPEAEFGAIGPTFRLLFGTANPRPPWPPPTAAELVGWGWLYALHSRSSIARGQLWQAECMLSAMRDQVLALACLRHDLPTSYLRGADRLPPEAVAGLERGLVGALDPNELRRAFQVVCAALVTEIGRAALGQDARLASVVGALANLRTD
jgi:hypothetical protein